jgi:hypothetical protein
MADTEGHATVAAAVVGFSCFGPETEPIRLFLHRLDGAEAQVKVE